MGCLHGAPTKGSITIMIGQRDVFLVHTPFKSRDPWTVSGKING